MPPKGASEPPFGIILGTFFDFEILILPVTPIPVAPTWNLISTRKQREHELGSITYAAFFCLSIAMAPENDGFT